MRSVIVFFLLITINTVYSQDSKNLNDINFEKGDTLDLPEFNFSYGGGYVSDPTFRDSIEVIAQFLDRHSKLRVEIINYTESRGSDEANLILSARRAKAVVDYLVFLGIDKQRVTSLGLGESFLIYSNEEIILEDDKSLKEKMHRMNRRTEMVILSLD